MVLRYLFRYTHLSKWIQAVRMIFSSQPWKKQARKVLERKSGEDPNVQEKIKTVPGEVGSVSRRVSFSASCQEINCGEE